MSGFLQSQMDYIFFIYGLSFIFVAALCLVLRARDQSLPWGLLAAFGIIHGVNEWLDMMALSLGDSPSFKAVRVCVMALSFLFLVEFGRFGTKSVTGKGPGGWITALLYAVGCAGGAFGWVGLNVFFRYFLGFVGGMWSALAFVMVSRSSAKRDERHLLIALGSMFAAYAMVSGLIVPKAPFVPASLLNQDSFMHIFGFPVQLLRGLLAAGFAIYVWQMLHLHETFVKRAYALVYMGSVLALLAGGWFFVDHTDVTTERKLKDSLLSTCQVLAYSIDPKVAEDLGSVTDTNDARNQFLRTRFMAILKSDPEYRWIYLISQKNDKIIFTADSEPITSKDYTPIGTAYADAPEVLRAVFRGEHRRATAEYEDKWGKWISAFVSIRNKDTGKTVAVLGVDRSQSAIQSVITHERLTPIVITLLVLVLMIVFFAAYERLGVSIKRILASEEALQESEEQYRVIFEGSTHGILMTDSVTKRFLYANPSICQMFGYTKSELLQLGVADIHPKEALGQLIPEIESLARGEKTMVNVVLPYLRKDGVIFYAEVTPSMTKFRGRKCNVGFFTDVTERRLVERRQQLSVEILGILNEPVELDDAINRVLTAIKQETEFDAVGLRLKCDGDFPYFAQTGFSNDFLLTENTLVVPDGKGGLCKDKDGNISLECTCGLVLSGQIDPANPLFTPAGSFWTNNSLPLLDIPANQEPRLHPRNRCMHEGYLSFALIPIRANQEIVGLLQLNDRKKDRLTLDRIRYFEGISGSIGLALMKKQAEEALRESEDRLDQLAVHGQTMIWEVDSDGLYTHFSEIVETILGYQPEELVGKKHFYDIHPEAIREGFKKTAFEVFARKESFDNLETVIEAKDGRKVWVSTNGIPILDDEGLLLGYRGADVDITKRKRAEEELVQSKAKTEILNRQLEDALLHSNEYAVSLEIAKDEIEESAIKLSHQASHDALTGLPNRPHFEQHLGELITGSAGKESHSFVVLFLDLDRFKLINDTLGHKVGDLLLIEVASRMQACLRSEDILARMGGDEFTIILPECEDRNIAESVASRIISNMGLPFEIEENRFVIGASIGLASFPTDGADAITLLKHADAAMYTAKHAGRATFRWFDGDVDVDNQLRADMEMDIRAALDKGQFHVYYQPITSLNDGWGYSAEALLRWEHPEKGMISPEVFIPIAEEIGLIDLIGDYVLRTACTQTKAWQDEGMQIRQISVNVSTAQVRDQSWLDLLRSALADSQLDPRCLNLEITETDFVADDEHLTASLQEATRMGIGVAIDDFGKGQSSLSRLKDFPVSHLKIDGSFIRNIEHDESDKALVQSIISMAQNQGMSVTAEWVETEAQMEILRSIGCDFAQGHFISPALPAAEFREFALRYQAAHPAQDLAA